MIDRKIREIVEQQNRIRHRAHRECSIEIREKPGAIIVRVSFADPNLNYFIKLKREQPRLGSDAASIRRSLAREYDNLRKLEAAKGRCFEIPGEATLDHATSMLVTSELRGIQFSTKYSIVARMMSTRVSDILRDVSEVGRALRSLHTLKIECEAIPTSMYTARFRDHLKHPYLPCDQEVVQALRRYASRIEADLASDRPMTTCHNDFGIDNVVITANGIGLLDFESMACNRPERDLATMYGTLREFLVWGSRRPHVLPVAWRAFTSGYGECVDVARIRPFLIEFLVNHLVDLAARIPDTTSVVRKAFFRLLIAYNRQLLRRMLAEVAG
jgi:aminoglycoside phosphotransferase (APT) family kinase protein